MSRRDYLFVAKKYDCTPLKMSRRDYLFVETSIEETLKQRAVGTQLIAEKPQNDKCKMKKLGECFDCFITIPTNQVSHFLKVIS